MSDPSPIVEFKSVAKSYGEGPLILEGIDFAARSGEFISLIGPSGCGKSTLLRLIAGLSPLTQGSLKIAGHAPDSEKAELAFVFQEPTLLPWLSVASNVELPQKLRGGPPDERKAMRDGALELVHLADRGDAYPRQLSGGQKMRVSIARALTLDPKILLLDEPFGALDEMTRERLNEELLAIRDQQSWTAFFVTHSVAEAVFLSNRILIMSARPGRIAHDVAIDLPNPRTSDTRLSRPYQDLVTKVSKLLRSVEDSS